MMERVKNANNDLAISPGNVGNHWNADSILDCHIVHVDALEATEQVG
jgi:hypothetical protein